MSLLLADIDGFREFNQHRGHAAGDRVLHEIARVIESTGRRIDLPARYGGEEFALVLHRRRRRGRLRGRRAHPREGRRHAPHAAGRPPHDQHRCGHGAGRRPPQGRAHRQGRVGAQPGQAPGTRPRRGVRRTGVVSAAPAPRRRRGGGPCGPPPRRFPFARRVGPTPHALRFAAVAARGAAEPSASQSRKPRRSGLSSRRRVKSGA